MPLREAPVDLPALEPNPGRPFGLYVHVPFCITRCGYCDFNTYTASEGVLSNGYAEQVLDELALAAKVVRPPRVDTVFFGGGTPTLLPPAELGRILDGIDRTWGLAAVVPGAADEGAGCGGATVSIGIGVPSGGVAVDTGTVGAGVALGRGPLRAALVA